ncbi:hypothetical protein HK099_006859 [Clydaea vesicula]|uniref:Phospholipid-transporting ATPase n=1 Tax=Clydaea vesicula TaxID=447962 RepID=A0AAD5U9S2_9FUNG|nr:hypothetical protein HK099_006859 [Clydaea vesicula]
MHESSDKKNKVADKNKLFKKSMNTIECDDQEDANSNIIYINCSPKSNHSQTSRNNSIFKSNKVYTSKYTFWSFLPKNLYEQFRSVANFYFLSLVILQAFRPFAIVSVGLTAAPIILIVGVTGVKDAVEDWRRHNADRSVNKATTYLLHNWKNQNFTDIEAEKNIKFRIKDVLKVFKKLLLFRRWSNNQLEEEQKVNPDFIYGFDEQLNQIGGQKLNENEKLRPVWKKGAWEEAKVGDFVLIRNNDPIPADVIIVSSSEPEAVCYVETKNLDGETNLKVHRGIQEFNYLTTPEDCTKMVCTIETEKPTVHMYAFNGNVTFENNGKKSTVPISINGILLRGCILRNTKWCIGIIATTGSNTKLMMNSGITPSKRSKIERQMNPQVLLNFLILFAMCTICGVLGAIYQGAFNFSNVIFALNCNKYEEQANIATCSDTGRPEIIAILTFFSCMIIFQNIIPIAIYISVDVAKTFQSYMIFLDEDMFCKESNTPALPRSWNLCDDLGQIEYVFSDKTGTLTSNVMLFQKCSINGVMYGHTAAPAVQPPVSTRTSSPAKKTPVTKNIPTRDESEREMREIMNNAFDTKYITKEKLAFVDVEMHQTLAQGIKILNKHSIRNNVNFDQAAAIIEFFTLLAVCHTVLMENPDPNSPHAIQYKAQSPDEAALVAAAKDNGFTFLKRVNDEVHVDIMGSVKTFRVLNILEFNSDRKRMSIIVRKENEEDVILLCKGADSVIYERLKQQSDESLWETTTSHLEAFANDGLRTLCLSKKIIPKEVYEPWAKEYLAAQNSVVDRDFHVDRVANMIESDLTLMGATAIEDKLQDGVPECISTLSKAGIKLWVLTGDKMETAINIGFACNLLQNHFLLIIIKSTTSEEETMKQLKESLSKFWTPEGAPTRRESFALVIDGDSLKFALENPCKPFLLELSCRCKAVICCRVSPLQKARVVSLVKRGLSAMCLAIGDGANDVSMIQEADVGVGISGKEGLQAVMASDYAISQFRFLSRLLLVHGKWSYMRIAEMVLNYFYKNVVWLFVLFWYQFHSGFTGDVLTDFTYGMFYNTLFTLLPNMVVGMFDQDVNDQISLQVPELYRKGLQQNLYTMERFWLYIFDGIFQSIVCYYFNVYLQGDGGVDSLGYDNDKNSIGTYLGFFYFIPTDTDIIQEIQKYYYKKGDIVSVDIESETLTSTNGDEDAMSPTVANSLLVLEHDRRRVMSEPVLKSATVKNVGKEVEEKEMVKKEDIKVCAQKTSLHVNIPSRHITEFPTIIQPIQRACSDTELSNSSKRKVSQETGPLRDSLTSLSEKRTPAEMAFSQILYPKPSPVVQTDIVINVNDTVGPKPLRGRIFSNPQKHNSIQEMIKPLTVLGKKTEDFFKSTLPKRLKIPVKSSNGRSMVFMGTHLEVPNTGFCFSHDGGMENLITPSRASINPRNSLNLRPSLATPLLTIKKRASDLKNEFLIPEVVEETSRQKEFQQEKKNDSSEEQEEKKE